MRAKEIARGSLALPVLLFVVQAVIVSCGNPSIEISASSSNGSLDAKKVERIERLSHVSLVNEGGLKVWLLANPHIGGGRHFLRVDGPGELIDRILERNQFPAGVEDTEETELWGFLKASPGVDWWKPGDLNRKKYIYYRKRTEKYGIGCVKGSDEAGEHHLYAMITEYH